MKTLFLILPFLIGIEYAFSQYYDDSGITMSHNYTKTKKAWYVAPNDLNTRCEFDQFKVTIYIRNNTGNSIKVIAATIDFGELELCDSTMKTRKIELVDIGRVIPNDGMMQFDDYIWVPIGTSLPEPYYYINWAFE